MNQQPTESDLRYASDPLPGQADSSVPGLQLPPPTEGLPLQQRDREVLRLAEQAFSRTGSWVVLGS